MARPRQPVAIILPQNSNSSIRGELMATNSSFVRMSTGKKMIEAIMLVRVVSFNSFLSTTSNACGEKDIEKDQIFIQYDIK